MSVRRDDHLIIMGWLVIFAPVYALADTSIASDSRREASHISRHDRAVCYRSEDEDRNEASISTCFVVKVGHHHLLVTASHVVNREATKSLLLSGKIKSVSQSILLSPDLKTKWIVGSDYDFAFLPLDHLRRHSVDTKSLERIAIDASDFLVAAPALGTDVEYTGFPVGLGASPPVSALVVTGAIASGEILTKESPESAPVLLSTPGAMSGTSGAPVFVRHADPNRLQLAGMVFGYVGDATGAKLTKIVPAWRIRALIDGWISRQATPLADPSMQRKIAPQHSQKQPIGRLHSE